MDYQKTYLVTTCECGHTCPSEFAVKDSEATHSCPNCIIEELMLKIKNKNKQLEKLKKKLSAANRALASYKAD